MRQSIVHINRHKLTVDSITEQGGYDFQTIK